MDYSGGNHLRTSEKSQVMRIKGNDWILDAADLRRSSRSAHDTAKLLTFLIDPAVPILGSKHVGGTS